MKDKKFPVKVRGVKNIQSMCQKYCCEDKHFDLLFIINRRGKQKSTIQPSMRRCRDISFRSHIGWDAVANTETLSRRRNWCVNETDLFNRLCDVSLTSDQFETSQQRTIDT